MLTISACLKMWLAQRPGVCLVSAYRHSYHTLPNEGWTLVYLTI